MKSHRLPILLIISFVGFLAPSTAWSVHTDNQLEIKAEKPKKKNQAETKKLDGLSVTAYAMAMAGLASFFFVPVAGLFLLPIAFITGMVAFFGKKRYVNRRGKGLALAAIILGGGFSLLLLISLAAFALSGF